MTDLHRPLPVADELSAGFWAAAAEHVLVLARCSRCGELSHPPAVPCPRCHHLDPGFEFERVGGAGAVRSWIVVRQSFLPGFQDDVPFVLVDVELDDGDDVRMIGRLLDGPDVTLAVGDRVRVDFEDLAPDTAVPAFRLDAR